MQIVHAIHISINFQTKARNICPWSWLRDLCTNTFAHYLYYVTAYTITAGRMCINVNINYIVVTYVHDDKTYNIQFGTHAHPSYRLHNTR
jgi:predicted Rdx family selenoprotein